MLNIKFKDLSTFEKLSDKQTTDICGGMGGSQEYVQETKPPTPISGSNSNHETAPKDHPFEPNNTVIKSTL